jgi:hypothetical protein
MFDQVQIDLKVNLGTASRDRGCPAGDIPQRDKISRKMDQVTVFICSSASFGALFY